MRATNARGRVAQCIVVARLVRRRTGESACGVSGIGDERLRCTTAVSRCGRDVTRGWQQDDFAVGPTARGFTGQRNEDSVSAPHTYRRDWYVWIDQNFFDLPTSAPRLA